jgi:hypothetical protein
MPDDAARDARAWLRHMRRGELEQAWTVSDRIRSRVGCFGDPAVPRHLQQIWNGTALEGRRVLVRCYHGLGDTLQFVRYVPMLAARAQTVTLWAQPELLPLLRTLDAEVTWLPLHNGTINIPFDVDLDIMELPHIFRSDLQTLPADVPYLHAPAVPLPASSRLRVGLIWRAGAWDPRRSIGFASLTPLLEDASVQWYGLQYDCRPDERHPHLTALDAHAIEKMAGYLQTLDLLISVDTMGAHLAGALGRPVWTLLPRRADWRWMEGRGDSPWYPTMRLFRQRRAGGWQAVIEAVRQALTACQSAAHLLPRTTECSSPRHSDRRSGAAGS